MLNCLDNRPAVKGYKEKKAKEMLHSMDLVLKHFKLNPEEKAIRIQLGGNLTCCSGIGASAANCVSVARAISALLGLNLTEEQINEAGYEGEKGYHGRPSGVDNTVSTFGGILTFQRTDNDPIFNPIKVSKPCFVVYGSTGITASTIQVVGDIRAKKEKDPEWFKNLEDQYNKIYDQAKDVLTNGETDWTKIGSLMNENHKLLQQLGITGEPLDELVDIALKNGCLGAKCTGTGFSMMFCITEDETTQNNIYEAIKAKVPDVWKTTIGLN